MQDDSQRADQWKCHSCPTSDTFESRNSCMFRSSLSFSFGIFINYIRNKWYRTVVESSETNHFEPWACERTYINEPTTSDTWSWNRVENLLTYNFVIPINLRKVRQPQWFFNEKLFRNLMTINFAINCNKSLLVCEKKVLVWKIILQSDLKCVSFFSNIWKICDSFMQAGSRFCASCESNWFRPLK